MLIISLRISNCSLKYVINFFLGLALPCLAFPFPCLGGRGDTYWSWSRVRCPLRLSTSTILLKEVIHRYEWPRTTLSTVAVLYENSEQRNHSITTFRVDDLGIDLITVWYIMAQHDMTCDAPEDIDHITVWYIMAQHSMA